MTRQVHLPQVCRDLLPEIGQPHAHPAALRYPSLLYHEDDADCSVPGSVLSSWLRPPAGLGREQSGQDAVGSMLHGAWVPSGGSSPFSRLPLAVWRSSCGSSGDLPGASALHQGASCMEAR